MLNMRAPGAIIKREVHKMMYGINICYKAITTWRTWTEEKVISTSMTLLKIYTTLAHGRLIGRDESSRLGKISKALYHMLIALGKVVQYALSKNG